MITSTYPEATGFPGSGPAQNPLAAASRCGRQTAGRRRRLLGLLAAIAICSLAAPRAVARAEMEEKEFSYVNYVPSAADFPAKLKEMSLLIEAGARLKSEKKEQAALAQFAKAIASGKALLKSLPRGYHDEVYQLLGYAEQQRGDAQKAIEYYDNSLARKPSNDIAMFNRAMLLRKSNRCREAMAAFREVEWRATAAKHEVLYEMSQCEFEQGRKEEARKLAERAFQAEPHYLPALRFLVQSQKEQLAVETDPLLRAQIEAQIAAELTLIVSLDTSDRAAALELGQMLVAKSDPLINAERLAEAGAIGKRLADQSGYTDAEGVRLLFSAQIKRGEFDQAKATLERGLAKSPDSELLKDASRQLEIEQGLRN